MRWWWWWLRTANGESFMKENANRSIHQRSWRGRYFCRLRDSFYSPARRAQILWLFHRFFSFSFRQRKKKWERISLNSRVNNRKCESSAAGNLFTNKSLNNSDTAPNCRTLICQRICNCRGMLHPRPMSEDRPLLGVTVDGARRGGCRRRVVTSGLVTRRLVS